MKFRNCKIFLHKITDDKGIHVCECVSIHLPLYCLFTYGILQGMPMQDGKGILAFSC